MPVPEEKFVLTHEGPAVERLDKLLGQASRDHSRARFQMLISQGHVEVDGTSIVDASFKVKPGSVVSVILPEAEDPVPQAEDIALNIVHEDDQIVVVD